MYLIFCFEEKRLRSENFRNNSSAVLLSILLNKVSNSFSGGAKLFYKISHAVKLALLELRRFGLAGQHCSSQTTAFHEEKLSFASMKTQLYIICLH